MKAILLPVAAILYTLTGCSSQGQQPQSAAGTSNNYSRLFMKATVIDSITVEEWDFLYSSRDEKVSVHGAASRCAFYNYSGLREGDTSKGYIEQEITFNKAGNPVSYKSHIDGNRANDYYWSPQQNPVFVIAGTNYTGKADTTFTRYRYDDYGNLLWKYEYKINEDNTREWTSYNEYSYFTPDSSTLIVYVKKIQKRVASVQVKELECTFKGGRLVSLATVPYTRDEIAVKESYQYRSFNGKDYLYSKTCDYSGKGTQYYIFERDSLGRLTENVDSIYNNEKRKYSSTRIVNEYKGSTRYERVYYTDSLLMFEHVKRENGMQEETAYSYDKYGNKTAKASGSPGKPNTVENFQYSYDKFNNWISRINYYSFDGDRHFRNISSENTVSENFRLITYFKGDEPDMPQEIPPVDAAAEEVRLKIPEEYSIFREMKYKADR